jgi:hypothetical protein
MCEFRTAATKNGGIESKRYKQGKIAMWRRFLTSLKEMAMEDDEVKRDATSLGQDIITGNISSRNAAESLIHTFVKSCNKRI